jgi:type VI secretion system Hcp family effector
MTSRIRRTFGRTSARYAILGAAAMIALAAISGAAHADVFMKITNTLGEATVRGYENQIALSGASFNIASYDAYNDDGLPLPERMTHVSPIMLNKAVDRASPKLMMAALNGGDIGTVEITFTQPTRLGHQPETRWVLEGARISSFGSFPNGDAGGAPFEMVEVSYTAIRYQYYLRDANGALTGAMEEVRWDVPASAPLDLGGGCAH